MLIGILLSGHVPDAIADQYGQYDWMFRQLLKGRGLQFRTYDVVSMEFPDSPDECDGWLISGSKHGAYDDLPFIPVLEDFIRAAHGRKSPIVGICFGHQIVAQALGGRVEKFSGGWSVGRTLYDGAWGPLALNAWHQDQVVEPPESATLTATTETCRYAGFTYPGGIWTIQPHPELNPGIFGDFIQARAEQAGLPRPLVETALARLDLPTDEPRVADQIARHFRAHARVPHV
jgi:GMP synthase (glutamine-hydrolysing)